MNAESRVNEKQNYLAAWRRLKWCYLIFFIGVLGLIFVPISIVSLFKSPNLATFAALVFLVLAGIFGFQIFLFICPKCKNMFFSKGGWQNIFGRKCRHCGTRIGEISSGVTPSNITESAANTGIFQLRRLIRYFFSLGLSYSVIALPIYLGASDLTTAAIAIPLFLLAFYLSGKLQDGKVISIILGTCAIILIIFGFIASGYAVRSRGNSLAVPEVIKDR